MGTAILLHDSYASKFLHSHKLTQYSNLHLNVVYLSRCFEIIWLLPGGLLCFSIIVICSSIR